MSRVSPLPFAALAALLLTTAGLWLPAQSGAVTADTARFVAYFEGFYSCVYADPAGHATIGYGHLIHLGAPTRKDRKRWGCIGRKKGLKLLRKDLKKSEKQVIARIGKAPVAGSMLTAMTSFAFNLGPAVLGRYRQKVTGRVTNITGYVRRGNYRRAARQMLIYNAAMIGGKRRVLPGLVTRRLREYRLMVRDIGRLDRVCVRNCGPGSAPVPTDNTNGSGGITVG